MQQRITSESSIRRFTVARIAVSADSGGIRSRDEKRPAAPRTETRVVTTSIAPSRTAATIPAAASTSM